MVHESRSEDELKGGVTLQKKEFASATRVAVWCDNTGQRVGDDTALAERPIKSFASQFVATT
jgi:hypothetical protein